MRATRIRPFCRLFDTGIRDGTAVGRAAGDERSPMSETAPGSEATVAAERLAFLARVGEILSSSLEFETTLERVATLAVEHLASFCSIDLLDEDGVLRNVAIDHAEPERAEWLRSVRSGFPIDEHAFLPALEVARGGTHVLRPEITDELLADRARSPEHLDILRRLAFGSVLIVPLKTRDHAFGTLSFATGDGGRRFGEDDVELALQLARRSA